MPGEYNEYAQGYREVIFPVPETTYGVPVHPSPTHAIVVQTTAFALAQERVNRADKTTSRSFRERISHRKSGTWSTTQYNLPSGTNGVAPDVLDLLTAAMGAMRTVPDTTIHASTPATTTVLTLTSGGGATLQVGDGIAVANAAGDYEVSFVESIATDAVTISPPLSAGPAAGTTVKGGILFKPANQLGSLCITRVLDSIVQVFPGCFANTVSFDFPSNGEGTCTIAGLGKNEFASGVSSLSVAADNDDTTITVATGEGKYFNINTRLLIGAEGANTDEVVLVTGVAGDVLTVTRAQASTAASAHAISAVIGPYQPAATTSGSPVSGTIGEAIITGLAGATRALSTVEMSTASISMTNNGALRNAAFGSDSASGFNVKKREVTFSMTAWLKRPMVGLYNQSKSFVMQEVMIQLGKSLGKISAHKLDRAEFTIPAVDAGGDDDVSVTFAGASYGSLAGGNDEWFIYYA